MKYLSIDCETTGVDTKNDQLLSIGIVIEDSSKVQPLESLPRLHIIVDRDRIEGNPYALNMNKDIIELMLSYQQAKKEGKTINGEREIIFCKEESVVEEIFNFLFFNGMLNDKLYLLNYEGHHKMVDGKPVPMIGMKTPVSTLTVAGKNFGTFDKLFLERLPRWKQVFQIHQRILDPAILYVDWKDDALLPNLKTCKERAGIEGEVTHDALEDAFDTIKVLRKKY
jgi:oligoribonuclease